MALILSVLLPLFPLRADALSGLELTVNGDAVSFDEGGLYVLDGDESVAWRDAEELYMLTGSGAVVPLSGGETAPTPTIAPDYSGGGELLYTDGRIDVRSDTVLVGLRYYISTARNTTLSTAYLQNAVGSGYEFGYYDSDRVFHSMASTEEQKLTLRSYYGTGIGVYATGTDTLLFELSYTSASRMLAVRPICEYGDAVTWFAGYQYYGDFLYVVQTEGRISVINALSLEQYVMGVCASEMNEDWPLEALKAQAVAARSYVGRLIGNSTYYVNYGFDLTADTYSQAYTGCGQVGKNIAAAVTATANQYLTYDGEICDAQYFSSDGGSTEDNRNVNGNNYHPYLRGVLDPYEEAVSERNVYSKWKYTFSPAGLGAKVGLSDVADVRVTYSETGNAIELALTSSAGKSVTVARSSCRTLLGLPSIHYTVEQDGFGQYVFSGGGWGHNLGMSQYGAYAMADVYEKNYEEILGFYYTGVGLSYGVIVK